MSKPASDAYRSGWEKIFGDNKESGVPEEKGAPDSLPFLTDESLNSDDLRVLLPLGVQKIRENGSAAIRSVIDSF